jgi:hypothetical protein
MSEVWQSGTWVCQWHMHIDGLMCSNTSMLGHTNSTLVKNGQKTQNLHPPKTRMSHLTRPTGRLWSISFQTFRISCGEWVEQVRTLRNGIGAIWKFDKSCTGPPKPKPSKEWQAKQSQKLSSHAGPITYCWCNTGSLTGKSQQIWGNHNPGWQSHHTMSAEGAGITKRSHTPYQWQ